MCITNNTKYKCIRIGNDGNDILQFSKLLNIIDTPTILITIDGNLSIPSDLPKDIVTNILTNKNIIVWATQNWDGIKNPKIVALPTGIGFFMD